MFNKNILFSFFLLLNSLTYGQLKWKNVDSLYLPLPGSVHVYFTDDKMDTANFRAFYVIADLKDKDLDFTTDTTYKRRLTPTQFYHKNNNPLVVVNGTFFSFDTHQNLNVVIKEGKAISYNAPVRGKGIDSTQYLPSYKSAIGISKRRTADVAWIQSDSGKTFVKASQIPFTNTGNIVGINKKTGKKVAGKKSDLFQKWKMKTAIGGGPVLLQNGQIKITNNEERTFAGKAINDKHPRTAIGYTKDNKLIILVIEGRNPNASGVTLIQQAQIFKDLGCIEALNLDGGGSSCLLINGKQTIKISDKSERPVPAVFLIKSK